MQAINKMRQGMTVTLNVIDGYDDDYGLEEGEIYTIEDVQYDTSDNVRRICVDALDKWTDASNFMVVEPQAGDSFWDKIQKLSTQRS